MQKSEQHNIHAPAFTVFPHGFLLSWTRGGEPWWQSTLTILSSLASSCASLLSCRDGHHRLFVPAGTRNSVKVSTLFVCEAPSPLGTWVTNIASVTVKFLFNCCLLVIPIVIPICSHCLCPSVTGRGGREEGRGASYLEFKSQQMLNHYTLSVYNNHSQITSNIAYKSNKYDILLSSSNYVILN